MAGRLFVRAETAFSILFRISWLLLLRTGFKSQKNPSELLDPPRFDRKTPLSGQDIYFWV